MRRIFALFTVIVLMFSLVACSSANNNEIKTTEESNKTEDQSSNITENIDSSSTTDSGNTADSSDTADSSNILIVYFTAAENSGVDAISSASVVTIDGTAKGMSQAVAEMIAEKTGGDLFSVQTSVVYPADFNELLDYAAEEQSDGVIPELTTHIENPDNYDTVFVGFPIWWYDIPQVLYAFFEEYDFSGKTIIPFALYNVSSISKPIATIKKLEPGATVIKNGLTVNQRAVADADGSVADWLTELGY